MTIVFGEMLEEYRVLDGKTKKDASEGFFNTMEIEFEGEEFMTPCRKNHIHVRLYHINNNQVIVGDEAFYYDRATSVNIHGDNKEQISDVKSELEKRTKGFKLIKVKNGN